MRRIEKVYQKLNKMWADTKENELTFYQGTSASELATVLQLSRANVSNDLNQLVREKKVLKVKRYPVRYLPVEMIEELLQMSVDPRNLEVKDLKELVYEKRQNKSVINDPFEQIIGSNDSLKKSITQAKAAIHYPPNGLHMLLLGQTGSGKTFFANKIYKYALYEKIISSNAPFESFNCADYYHNPQLLMSQLFGYVKGAFTGADKDCEGLVEQADGGVLLLDEVHRLTPEGQEMLFYFIDHGYFNRLGENGFKRQANVLIICATTEDPNSSLLTTFLRRIPMTIQIPPLNERSLNERIKLTKFLFSNEAKRIQRTFLVDIDVINALIHTVDYGNVGQLKTQVQLICAQAFLNHLYKESEIKIGVKELPDEMQAQWVSTSRNIKKTEEIATLLDMTTIIHPNDQKDASEEDYNDGNIYELIKQKVSLLETEGIPKEQIHQYILTDLHLHVRNFVSNKEINYNLLKFVDPAISELTLKLKEIADSSLNFHFDRRFIYYVGMHLDSYLKRDNKENFLSQLDINEIKTERKKEYETAQLFSLEIENSLGVLLPEIEILYLTMLLVSIMSLDDREKVSVLVVTHGNSTASSMVNVATELLGAAPISALDMPLNISPEELFEKLSQQVRFLDNGCGVLMLVDMGSLAMMETRLIQETNVDIKTMSNVTTSMVLDVVRKVNYMELDLSSIYYSIYKDFLSSIQMLESDVDRPKAILSICTTGSGTAEKLEKMIINIIQEITDEHIYVLSVSALKLKEEIPKLTQDYHILASVGTKNPKIDAPFIRLENMIDGQGEKALRQLINPINPKSKKTKNKNVIVEDLCYDALQTYLVYLNPYHITGMLLDWVKDLQIMLTEGFSNTLTIKLVVHTAFAFERVIKKSALNYTDNVSDEVQSMTGIVADSIKTIEEQLMLDLNIDEKMFIAEVILNE